MSSSSLQTNENGGFSHVWRWAIIVHNSIEKINMSRVMRFTVTANVEFLGLVFGMPVASHSSLSDGDLTLSQGEFYYPSRVDRYKSS